MSEFDLIKQKKLENLHIVFWLVKDLCWCLIYKPLAVAMIFPTLSIAIYLTVKSKSILNELYHNLAITLWIIANSIWMITEFLRIDEKTIFNSFTYKHLAVVPFILGLLLLAFYYLWAQKASKK